jgi:hypothetical protein
MLSKKIFNTLRNTVSTANARAAALQLGQQGRLLPFMSMSQFGSCGTGSTGGGCGSKKCLSKFSDDI